MPRYPAIRKALAPEYQALPSDQIEAIVQGRFGAVEVEDVEGFLDTLKSIGGAVTKALPAVLPVAGTVVGTAFGGPLGGVVGSQLGSLAGGAIGQATAPGGRRVAAPSTPQRAPGGGSPPAAAQLLGILNRPEILQALMSMIMGPAGGRSVPIGGASVPTGAIANLIGTLANQAVEEERYRSNVDGESLPTYLMDSFGEYRCDPAVPEQRAEIVLQLLHQSLPEVTRSSFRPRFEDESFDESDETDEMYDSLEFDEMALDAWEDD